jgi:hypothetical protein
LSIPEIRILSGVESSQQELDIGVATPFRSACLGLADATNRDMADWEYDQLTRE